MFIAILHPQGVGLNKHSLKMISLIIAFISGLFFVGCSIDRKQVNATPRIVSVSPSEGSVSVRPDKVTFVVGGTNQLPFFDTSRVRVLESYGYYLNSYDSGKFKTRAEFINNLLSLNGANIIKDHQEGRPFVMVDSTSECAPTLTFDNDSLKVYQDYFDQTPARFTYTLSGDSCVGKKLVLTIASTALSTFDFGNLGQNPDCKIIEDVGNQKVCFNYSYADSYLLQKYTYRVAGVSNLSAACQAINNIGVFTLTGNSQSRVDTVSTLGASETVTVSYTKNTSLGGEQIIVRWLEANDTQIDPPIVTTTTTGSTAGASQPATGAKLRTYSVSGSWTVQYSCIKN